MNKKITALTGITPPIDRTFQGFPFVQGGVTKKLSADEILNQYEVTGTLTSAQILNIGFTTGTPVSVIPAPGVGYYVRILRVDGWMEFNSVVYAASTVLTLRHSSATKPLYSLNKILESTVDLGEPGILQDIVLPGQTLMFENESVEFTTFSGTNPTAGDSDVRYRIVYEIAAIP